MAKLPEGRSTLTDEQMIGLTHRLVDTCIDCKARIEVLIAERDEAWKRAAHAEEMWGKAEVKLAKAEAAIYRITPYLSASLDELDCGSDYIEACNQVFEADSITIAELTGGKDE